MATVLDEVTALAKVERGRLVIQNKRQFDQMVGQLDPRWQLEVTVKRLRATRSQQSNRFYWGVCVAMVSEHTGYQPEEIHNLAKQMFLPKVLSFADGNGEVVGEYVLGGSTRTLNSAEFSTFVERFRHWASTELDINIPDANMGPVDADAG